MKELKCPQCGNVFQVDEADYASIVSQVKTSVCSKVNFPHFRLEKGTT